VERRGHRSRRAHPEHEGVVAVDAGGTLADLDVFAEALAGLVAARSRAVGRLPQPDDVGAPEPGQEATGSNEPLISAELSATGRPERALLGVPVFLSGACSAA
jgi:hypothetical protein